VGEASPLGDSTSIPTNWLLGIWVDVPHRARIVSFGLWATGQATDCDLQMALYTDDAGEPDALLGRSFVFDPPATNTAIETAPQSLFNVEAGRYWVMTHYRCTGSPTLFREAASGKPDMVYAVVTSGSIPSTFPGAAATFEETALNHYLVIQDLP
jgi:hypothetical protein